jgi:hypothetical protein
MAAMCPMRGLLRKTAFAVSLAANTCTAMIMPKVLYAVSRIPEGTDRHISLRNVSAAAERDM